MDGDRLCPSCGAAISPAYRICPRCGATIPDPDWDALDSLRARITDVDAALAQLVSQRHSLVGEYEQHRLAITSRMRAHAGKAPAADVAGVGPRSAGEEWSGARVRVLLLGLGAALLGISALTFTAVAWSRLGDAGRAVLLLAATALITALALALRRRLPMTAEAFAGLAIALALIDVFAGRRAGVAAGMSWQLWWAMGVVAVAGFAAALGLAVGRRTTRFAVAALLPLAPELVAGRFEGPQNYWLITLILAALAALLVVAWTRWAGVLYRESRSVLLVHAAASWLWAAVLAVSAAGYPTTIPGAAPTALAVASLAVAPELARRRLKIGAVRTFASAVVAAVPASVVLTLAAPVVEMDGLMTTAVIAGGATVLVALLVSAFRVGGVGAGIAFAAPGTAVALTAAVPAVLGPLGWLAEPWSGSVHAIAREAYLGPQASPALTGSWSAVGSLVAVAAVALIVGLRRPLLIGIASAATALAVVLGTVTAGSTVLVTLIALTGVIAAAALTAAVRGAALLPGAAIAAVPTIGWAAVSPAASVVVLAVTALIAGGAALVARTDGARALFGALAALLGVSFVGVAVRAAGADAPAAGFAAAAAAGAVVILGAAVFRGLGPIAPAMEITGAVSAGVSLLVAAADEPWLAGALTALAGVAVLAARHPARRVYYASAAALLGFGALSEWLSAADLAGGVHGFALSAAAGVVVLLGLFGLRADETTGAALERLGGVAVVVGLVVAATSSAWLAGTLTALVALSAVAALRADRRASYGAAAGIFALSAVWAWLWAAHVGVVEAYTAPAAAVAFIGGIVRWRRGPGGSWLALGPGLVLAIGPTLVLGMADDDLPRLIVAALLSLVAVVAGAVRRLQAPLCLGAVALLVLAVDQWGDDIVRMPRWISLGAVGVLLMWIGATFEHRRRDWRRASEVLGHLG